MVIEAATESKIENGETKSVEEKNIPSNDDNQEEQQQPEVEQQQPEIEQQQPEIEQQPLEIEQEQSIEEKPADENV